MDQANILKYLHGNDDITNESPETGIGQFIGDYCNSSCSSSLSWSYCNLIKKTCECEPDYPVQLPIDIGCTNAANLGEQCFYSESCSYYDPYATCIQIKHNAFCQCISGYHIVASHKSSRKDFCSQDLIQITTDINTLLLVIAGLIVFSTLICFVLKLFVGFRSNRYQNATITTRLLSTSEIAQVARSLSETNNNNHGRRKTYSRRGSQGVMVSSSRATAARAAAILLVSCHIPPTATENTLRKSSDSNTGSTLLIQNCVDSPRSYSAKQFKREWDKKEAAKNRRTSIKKSASMDQFSSFMKSPPPSQSTSYQSNEKILPDVIRQKSNGDPQTSQCSTTLCIEEGSVSR